MKRPFVFAAGCNRSDSGGLTFFDGIDEIIPGLNFRGIHTGLLAKLLIIPEDYWCRVVWQTVQFAVHRKVLQRAGIKGIAETICGGFGGNVLANARTDLFVHHSATPAVKGAGLVFGLKQGGKLGFEGLVFEVIKFNSYTGMTALILLGGFLPNRSNFRQ